MKLSIRDIMAFGFLLLPLSAFAIANSPGFKQTDRTEVVQLYFSNEYELKIKTLDQFSVSFCSGVAISDRAVLTAGHCALEQIARNPQFSFAHVVKFNSKQSPSLTISKKIYTNFKWTVSKPGATQPTAKATARCTQAPSVTPESVVTPVPFPDYAIVEFAPNTFQQWATLDLESPVEAGQPVEFWGYGLHEESFLVKTVPPITPDFEGLGRLQGLVSITGDQKFAVQNDSKEGSIEFGDSGGPVFRNNLVVGINATRGVLCPNGIDAEKTTFSIATKVMSFKEDLEMPLFKKLLPPR